MNPAPPAVNWTTRCLVCGTIWNTSDVLSCLAVITEHHDREHPEAASIRTITSIDREA